MRQRDAIALGVFAVVAVAVVFFMLVIKPKRDDAGSYRSQADAAQAATVQLQSQLAQYRQASRSFRKDARQLATVTRAVPLTQGMPELLRQLDRTAHRVHVDLGAVTPAPPTTATAAPVAPAGVSTLPVQLTFEGSFFHLERLFARIDRFIRVTRHSLRTSGRLLSVDTLTVGLGTAGYPALDAQVGATVYVLNAPAGLPGAPAAAPATTTPVVTGAPTATTATTATTPATPAPTPAATTVTTPSG